MCIGNESFTFCWTGLVEFWPSLANDSLELPALNPMFCLSLAYVIVSNNRNMKNPFVSSYLHNFLKLLMLCKSCFFFSYKMLNYCRKLRNSVAAREEIEEKLDRDGGIVHAPVVRLWNLGYSVLYFS